MSAYYNEIDPFAAQWLRNLISAGRIAPGDVDERSIVDVRASDIAGYTQCHFFAGIGGWSLALRLAGWPDDRPVWTGSCPCQDFSAAGKGAGFAGERHLWPVWFPLIRECRPRVVFGEQVASPLALSWLDLVQADMEGADYAFAAFDLCAAGVGAPHIRQRLGFVADTTGEQLTRWQSRSSAQPQSALGGHDSLGFVADAVPAGRAEGWTVTGDGSTPGRSGDGELADAELPKEPRQRSIGWPAIRIEDAARPSGSSLADGLDRDPGDAGVLQGHALAADSGLADTAEPGRDAQPLGTNRAHGRSAPESGRLRDAGSGSGPLHVDWRDADWLLCRDGKWRPVEPGTFPLAHGVPGRVGRLRAYGNAIVPALWAELIGAYLDLEQARAA